MLPALLVVGPAGAHDYLVGSTPENGETVASAPTQVQLDFNTSIGEQFAQVAVIDSDGATYQQGDPVVDGPRVVQAVADVPDGVELTISYRVVSSDGHPIGGTVPFTVAAAEAAPDEPSSAEQTPAVATPQVTEQTAAATDSSSAAPWLIAGVAALLAAAVAAAVRRVRSST